MKAAHFRILQALAEAEQEQPSLRGRIPVGLMLEPKLCGVFKHPGQLGQAIKCLHKGGFIEVQRDNPLGSVAITNLGKYELRKNKA